MAATPTIRSSWNSSFFKGGGRPDELPSWDIDVPVYPPSTFLVLSPAGLAAVSNRAIALVPDEWLPTRHCCGPYSLPVSRAAAVACHRAGLFHFGYQRNSAGTWSAGDFRHFADDYWQLSLLSRPLSASRSLSCLSLSLAVKPQIGGLIVLYFLAQRIHWRYAAVALTGALALLLSAGLILKLHPRSAEWTSTLRANLSATLSPGGSADPRPANIEAVGDTNLQTLDQHFLYRRADI